MTKGRRARGKEGMSIIEYISNPQTHNLHHGLEFQEGVFVHWVFKGSFWKRAQRTQRVAQNTNFLCTSEAAQSTVQISLPTIPTIITINIKSQRDGQPKFWQRCFVPQRTCPYHRLPSSVWGSSAETSTEMEKEWWEISYSENLDEVFLVILSFSFH